VLNARAATGGASPREVAADWLVQHGFASSPAGAGG
jgi:hypothetical protein